VAVSIVTASERRKRSERRGRDGPAFVACYGGEFEGKEDRAGDGEVPAEEEDDDTVFFRQRRFFASSFVNVVGGKGMGTYQPSIQYTVTHCVCSLTTRRGSAFRRKREERWKRT
jgi:hypothetical protein